MRKQLFIGALISGICLYVAVRGLSLTQIWEAIQLARGSGIFAGMAVFACGFVLRALRWQILLQPIQSIPVGGLLSPLVVGFFANNILPFRMGELIRAHITGRKFGISRTASLGTIVLERIFDALCFLGIFLAVSFLFPFPEGIKHGARAMGIGCVVMIVAFWLAYAHQTRAYALLDRWVTSAKWRERIRHLMVNFVHGISGMRNATAVAKIIFYSIGVWLLEGTTLYLVANAFSVNLGFPQAFFVLFFLGLSVTLPQAPGYIGTVELFGSTALALLGIPREQGFAIILTLHGAEFAFIAAGGLYALWKDRISFSSLLSGRQNPEG